ncbi:MAG TPA: helix-turn-helix domain-containing protein [Ignavibacteria bacterium]|nr:helix-turn-helix domain-containing protein [Ignavibacteria bacterium]
MKDIIQNLEALGFTNYESKVFCVLFEGNLMTASEIAKKADIARSSAYDILKSFTEKGICNEIQTSSVAKYEIIDPKVVQDKIEKEIHDSYTSKTTKLKDSFDKLTPIFKAKELEGEKVDVELIKGFNKHRFAKFMQMVKDTKKEFLLMNKLEGRVDTETDEVTRNFVRGGGILKSIYEASSDFKVNINGLWQSITPEHLPKFVTELQGDGGEVRLAKKIYQNMAISDRKVVFISLVDPTISRYNRSDIIVKNQNFAESMAEFFEQCWNKAETAEEFSQSFASSLKG